MKIHNLKYPIFAMSLYVLIVGCNKPGEQHHISIYFPSNSLDYIGTPTSATDRNSLAFSDQGAWFAYGFPSDSAFYGGFSGPFLMTQENGVWSSPSLSQFQLKNNTTDQFIDWTSFSVFQNSYSSHLEQSFKNNNLSVFQTLFFVSPHTALITTEVKNTSNRSITFEPSWKGALLEDDLSFKVVNHSITITGNKSTSKGKIQTFGSEIGLIDVSDSTYQITLGPIELKSGESKQFVIANQFIFPEYDIEQDQQLIESVANDPEHFLSLRKGQKANQLSALFHKMDINWNDSIYKDLVAKTTLTLQNNWRVAAGELKHSGLFPSYHYYWFHGLWAWDSWKHAVALAQYDPPLATEQVKVMYDFMDDKGFIADCVFRDTTVENHNYRNTKPPLSAWSAWNVYKQSKDDAFLKEIYPKIQLQHDWWYTYRDHDQDGICEYGSTDGSLIAAKWESGMDNAVRFDSSAILKNSESAFSLDQESVDLNSYLYAEKLYLVEMAYALYKKEDAMTYKTEAKELQIKIQDQFYDPNSGWFYDTSMDGQTFIKAMGCEGWIPLWANVATSEQAEAVKNNMVNPEYFNTKVPFQTLTASHPKFKPDGGYWRGPNWLDQAYFGVRGLHNYGFHEEAYDATYKLFHNAEGLLIKGPAIRENYQPITGAGLESENFSWSAAHYLLLLLNE